MMDAFSGLGDLCPVIQHYILDTVDRQVAIIVAEKYPQMYAAYMTCWDVHKAELARIFEENYARDTMPKWVDYDELKEYMIVKMAAYAFDQIDGEVEYIVNYGMSEEVMSMYIELADTVAIALCVSGIEDRLERPGDHLNAGISVNLAHIMDKI